MEALIAIYGMGFLIACLGFCLILDNIKIELRYRNKLLEEQNELVKKNKL